MPPSSACHRPPRPRRPSTSRRGGGPMTLLETRGLTVTYGGLNANDNVDIAVEPGKLIGLIGPNGAGKTTFIDAITGFTKPSRAARSTSTARRSTSVSPDDRAHLGLSRTFQSLELFEDLTVRDNLLVAAERPQWYSIHRRRLPPRPRRRRARGAGRLGARRHRARRASPTGSRATSPTASASWSASPGRWRRRPKLILLDEPAAGLDTAESQMLGSHLRQFLDARHHGVPHRPRHGPRAQRVRLHLRARLRSDHRRGHAGRDPRQPRRDRRLPRRERRGGAGTGGRGHRPPLPRRRTPSGPRRRGDASHDPRTR